MRISPTRIAAAVLVMFVSLPAPSVLAAVQLGMHMDFVLSNGTTVRVFPAAPTQAVPGERPAFQPTPRPTTTALSSPAAACTQLDQAYNQVRQGTTPMQQRASLAQLAEIRSASGRPAWITPTPSLQKVVGTTALARMAKPTSWYYLPTTPRLSFKEGKPEAMFVKFQTSATVDRGGVEGGLFHLLVTYGLTQAEEAELRTELAKAVPGATLRGQVDLVTTGTDANFVVTSGTLSDTGFTPRGVLTSGFAPTVPGGKAAMAGRLSPEGATLLETTFDNTNGVADLSVTFVYDYVAKTPAFTGVLTMDLDQINQLLVCGEQTGTTQRNTVNTGVFGLGRKDLLTVTGREVREAGEVLRTLGAVDIHIDQNLPDIDVAQIESALMTNAMESFLTMQRQFLPEAVSVPNPTDDEDEEGDGNPAADNFQVYEISKKNRRMEGRLTYRITKDVALYRRHVMTGNMGADLRRYREGVFSLVPMDDPFFRRGEIHVTVDPESFPLFAAQQVNNATVALEVKLAGVARPFTQQAIFVASDVVGPSPSKTFTFATQGKGPENANCLVSYTTSWSLRGIGQWPRNPPSVCSRQTSITLTPPLASRAIDVEADLGEMEAAGFRAADVLLRHTRYGQLTTETVKFRVAEGVGYRSTTLFIDKNESAPLPPVEYSIVFTHREAGPLPPTPWRRLEADFVIANVSGLPAEYLRSISGTVEGVRSYLE